MFTICLHRLQSALMQLRMETVALNFSWLSSCLPRYSTIWGGLGELPVFLAAIDASRYSRLQRHSFHTCSNVPIVRHVSVPRFLASSDSVPLFLLLRHAARCTLKSDPVAGLRFRQTPRLGELHAVPGEPDQGAGTRHPDRPQRGRCACRVWHYSRGHRARDLEVHHTIPPSLNYSLFTENAVATRIGDHTGAPSRSTKQHHGYRQPGHQISFPP